MAFPTIPSLGSLSANLAGQVLERTFLIQASNSPIGIPIPLAVLDVVKEEHPEFSADVTEHPVEQGPEVSDHIQLRSPTLRLRGKISNTPLDIAPAVANLLSSGIAAITSSQARTNLLNTGISQGIGIVGAAMQGKAADPVAAGIAGAQDSIARTALLAAFQNQQPFDVVTKRQTFTNMVIRSLRFPRSEETGYALEFDMELKQLVIVTPQTVPIKQLSEDVIPSASSVTSLGAQSTQAANTQVVAAVKGSSLSSNAAVAAKSPGF